MMRRVVVCWLAVAALSIFLSPTQVAAQDEQPEKRDFRPSRHLREQPPIVRFAVKGVDDVVNTLDEKELVLGVTVADDARAYPINMLTGPQREIINDRLGDKPIAATW